MSAEQDPMPQKGKACAPNTTSGDEIAKSRR
jgi:hypothetical protein